MWNPITSKLEQAEETFAKAIEKHQDTFVTNPEYATSWSLDSVLEAQVYVEIVRNYGTDQAAVDQWAKEFEQSGLRYANRGESKSTSQAKNLCEDVRANAQLKLYTDLLDYRKAMKATAEAEAKRQVEVSRIGQAVRHVDSPDERINAGMVFNRGERSGRVQVVFPGGENVGVESFWVNPGDLRVTGQEPYAKVQRAYEAAVNEAQLSADVAAAEEE